MPSLELRRDDPRIRPSGTNILFSRLFHPLPVPRSKVEALLFVGFSHHRRLFIAVLVLFVFFVFFVPVIIVGVSRRKGLAPFNLIVWAKTNAGMGSLYRSQHELLPLFKNGKASHINNVELGKNGRWRSNVWTYPGASSMGSEARKGLQHHPTVKPVAMLEDALLDMTERGDIVLDPFLGSGSTLIAAENTGRRCRGLELDPLYVDVILRRYEAMTGRPAVLESTGETYAELAARRQRDAEARPVPLSNAEKPAEDGIPTSSTLSG